ncbi:MAG: hypothetical protein ABFD91_03990 [Anaerohalosphaeraceae bacterium]
MGKLYLVVLYLSFFSLCNGSLSVDIDYGLRYSYDSYSGEYLEQYFIEKLTIENSPDLVDVAYIGLRPTCGSSVSIGHGTIHVYSTNELLYSHHCLDDYLDPLQSIHGTSLMNYIGPSDMFSAINDGWGKEDLWYVVPKGGVPLELLFIPEPCTLSLLAFGAFFAGRKRTL